MSKMNRRVQVFIGMEASEDLDAIMLGLGCGQTKAIEMALSYYAEERGFYVDSLRAGEQLLSVLLPETDS